MGRWTDSTLHRLSQGSPHPPCARGCVDHPIAEEPIHINLDHAVSDYPKVQWRPDLEFYYLERPDNADTPGYCPAVDAFPLSLQTNAMWEGFETALVIDILDGSEGIVMDFGANLGWYSVLAGKRSYDVISVEADPVIRRPLQKNLKANGISPQIATGFIDHDTEHLEGFHAPHVRLIKADVEGAEGDVLRVCRLLFQEGKVDYAIIELTPVFTSWRYVQDQLDKTLQMGYQLRIMPDKGFPPGKFSDDPIGSTLSSRAIIDRDQVMGLLVREDLL